MRRRKFLLGTGVAAATALAGCTGSSSPPPRKSNVISGIDAQNNNIQIDIADNTWVQSRYDAGGSQALADPDDVGGLSPVGKASAKGKGGGGGRGATGRGSGGYSSAPKTTHGRAWFHGGAYTDDWYDDHEDEVTRYSVAIAALGVAYLGSNAQFQDDKPGAGDVPWDEVYRDPDDAVEYPIDRQGWYRVGANIRGQQSNHDFRWEAVDFQLEGSGSNYEITEQWKVSPRI